MIIDDSLLFPITYISIARLIDHAGIHSGPMTRGFWALGLLDLLGPCPSLEPSASESSEACAGRGTVAGAITNWSPGFLTPNKILLLSHITEIDDLIEH
jgi:hypothetical protein